MKAPADAQARALIRTDLDRTLLVEAAAGTGKTTALVSRIVALVTAGKGELRHIVAVTFTDKAAGELKLRVRTEIERARAAAQLEPAARARLEHALEQLEEARIGTIHSFCADLLREQPIEAAVDPGFEVASEEVARALYDEAFARWFESILSNCGEGMRRLLRRRDREERDGPRALARRAAEELRQWRDFEAPWAPHPFARDRAIDGLVAESARLGALAQTAAADDYLAGALSDIWRPVAEATRLEAVGERDYDALEQVLVDLLRNHNGRWSRTGRLSVREFGPDCSREQVLGWRADLQARLEDFRQQAGANLAPLLRAEMWPLIGLYEDLKRRRGLLDFLDLLRLTRDLLRDRAAVRAKLQARFSHIFVDEFQDTDPLQAEILMLLAGRDPGVSQWEQVTPVPGKLFIVGDPKQSIYRFRRADVALYQRVKRQLINAGARLLYLTVSFRTTPELAALVNTAMAPRMAQESDTQPRYVPIEPYREQPAAQPSVVVLPVPDPYGDYGQIHDWKIEQSVPEAVAAYIKWLLASGWRVSERESPDEPVPIRARHICVLFRRLNSFGTDITRPYIRALEARQIPHVLVRGGSFNQREEVTALRNLLGAIERPDDELMVFAALRGPMLALSDAALLGFRESVGRLHPFVPLPADAPAAIQEVGRALALLGDLHRRRNRRPIAATISALLEQTRAHAGFAIWPTGEQALANLMRLMDLARRYEARGGAISFRGFVDYLEERAEHEEASEAPIAEEGTEGVRLMTVHSAKGLEFPIVILADPTCRETREPSRYVDSTRGLCALRLAGCAPEELIAHAQDEARRDREEATRVLYVAATRARDLLVVTAVGDDDPAAVEPRQGWLAGLAPAIFPPTARRRTPLPQTVAGLPAFGADSVAVRNQRAPSFQRSVAPGLHQIDGADYRVLWWDPAQLELDVRETMGLRQSRLLEADDNLIRSTAGRHLFEAWQTRRTEILAAGARPALAVQSATARAQTQPLAVAESVAIEQIPRQPGRPHGPRFGTLVHLVMLRVELTAPALQVERVARGEGRMLGASEAEIVAAAHAVSAALTSPLMARAARARELRRECAVLARLEGEEVIEGVVDLAFLEGEEWIVVDFKTDIDLAPALAHYRTQLAIYTQGIAAASGRRARGVLLWI
ncbi:MAG TPA: UvrD-helicase domain-containing protein [Candidatus Binataceae bacterium]|nr:UvrD-helicase domain-containing protein [Candidatus Binataceae bacterium]